MRLQVYKLLQGVGGSHINAAAIHSKLENMGRRWDHLQKLAHERWACPVCLFVCVSFTPSICQEVYFVSFIFSIHLSVVLHSLYPPIYLPINTWNNLRISWRIFLTVVCMTNWVLAVYSTSYFTFIPSIHFFFKCTSTSACRWVTPGPLNWLTWKKHSQQS